MAQCFDCSTLTHFLKWIKDTEQQNKKKTFVTCSSLNAWHFKMSVCISLRGCQFIRTHADNYTALQDTGNWRCLKRQEQTTP